MIDGNVEVAVTGKAWMGKGVGSIWTMLEKCISGADDEILIAAYSISENSMDLLGLIEGALHKGVRVTLIVNRLDEQDLAVREKLAEMNKGFKDFILKDFSPQTKSEDLHAKLIVIDHDTALVGSANLTWKGMVLNHELMVKITGRNAGEVGKLADRLSASTDSKTIQKRSGR